MVGAGTRGTRNRALRVAGIALVVALLTPMLAPAASGQDADGGKLTFVWGDDNDLDSMNPFVAVEAPAFTVFYLTYDLLVNLGQEDLSPSPGLAESWETSEDGKTWTFKIREGVEWSDGEPLTAHDVAYTYNRVIEDKEGCCIDYLRVVETVEAPDDTTVVIETKEPTSQLLTAIVFILPEHIWSDIDKKEAKTFENNPPVGSGPFHVTEWKKGQFFTMEANDDYWGGDPHIDEVTYRIFNNEDAVTQALKSGEIDFTSGLSANLYESLQNDPNLGTHEANISSFDEIGMNVGADAQYPDSDGHPALKDVAVRQAMSHAVDKELLAERVLRGYGEVGETIVPPFSAGYHYEPPEEELFPFDLGEANNILDEAGYEDTDGDGVREMPGGGRPLEFRYYVRSEDNRTTSVSQFVKGWFEEIGIATNVKALGDTKLTNVIYEGNYDIFHWGWFPDPDPDFILSIFTCGQRPPDGIWSDSFYCNEEYDRMYLEQKTIIDVEERAEVVKQMQQMVYEDAPYIVLWYDTDLQVYNKEWTGFQPQPEPDGDLLSGYGNFAFTTLRKASADDTEATSSTGISAGVWGAIIIGGIVLVGGVMLLRRRAGDEDRA
ncbi:ABC transporter substrate-binding protein [soil metagenome]